MRLGSMREGFVGGLARCRVEGAFARWCRGMRKAGKVGRFDVKCSSCMLWSVVWHGISKCVCGFPGVYPAMSLEIL